MKTYVLRLIFCMITKNNRIVIIIIIIKSKYKYFLYFIIVNYFNLKNS